jgi:putative heme-binding domain-containing protein
MIAFALCLAWLQDDPSPKLDTLPGFTVEQVLKADPAAHGSWINMARDPKGRLLLGGQRNQPVTRVTIEDGRAAKLENLQIPVSETMGMLFAFDALYLNGMGKDDKGRNVFGLFRCRDTKGEDRFDHVEFLREWKGGPGEHGAHGIVAGRDGKLYVVNGNFTDLPNDLLPSSPFRHYGDDRVPPRAEDGNGFGAGRKPPGGYVVRLDPDGKNAELFSSGQRNTYDIAMSADGEIFGFDSDMEWDWGAPWYRGVKVFHAVSGGDEGFREGTAKWPNFYPDSRPPVVEIGIGCPTGVTFGYGARFPAKYQKALYILDWTYGRLIAVHLEPHGAGYRASWENFVAPKGLKGGPKVPLNLTDAVVGADGALYFTVGGRNTQARLFRVTYAGPESVAPATLEDSRGSEARAKRRALEAFHGREEAAAVDAALSALGDEDEAIRYAARVALERQPLASWAPKVLAEPHPQAALNGLLALARVGGKDLQPEVHRALGRFPAGGLSEETLLRKIRVIQVSIARHGLPAEAEALAADLLSKYPSSSPALDLELCQALIALEAPEATARSVALLDAAATQEEQIGYALHLRKAVAGWAPGLRKTYFSWWLKDRSKAGHPETLLRWFAEAGRGYGDGASLPKFLANLHAQAKAALSPDEAATLADVLAAYVPAGPSKAGVQPRKRSFVKEWKTEELLPLLDRVGKDRHFERGKAAYEATQCLACHRFGNDGGASGPDLTAIASRFSRQDILESILDPSKVISEQFQATLIRKRNGDVLDGRVVEETAEKVVLHPNQLLPDKVTVMKADIEARQPSKTSPMPPALVNTLTEDEILDLLAYLESGGRKDHPAFAALRKTADVTDVLAAAVKGGRLRVTAGNDLFGDPAPGEVKRLRVEFAVGGAVQAKTVSEGASLEVAAPEGAKLEIRRALYGVFQE